MFPTRTATLLSTSLTNPATSSIQNDQERRLRLLRLFCLLSLLAHSIGILTLVAMTILVGQPLLLTGPSTSLLAIICFITSYWWGGKGYYRSACWLLILANVLSISVYAWVLGTGVAVVTGYFIPIGLAILLMNNWEIALTTLACSLSATAQYLAEAVFKTYTAPVKLDAQIQALPNIALATIIIPIIVVLLTIPARNLNQALALLQVQTDQLHDALQELETRQHTSQQVSQQVLSLATELKATASQQAGGSQEQVAALSQVQVSVNELSMTAANIDSLTDQVKQATSQVAENSQQIAQTTTQSVINSVIGLHAVNHTMEISSQVAELYQELVTRLNQVTTQNTNIRTILKLLNTLAAEIHLLSLNASIEAAGAGQYGARFKVVAQEVKSLANRSATASKEMVELVQSIEAATQAAEISVQQGSTKAEELLSAARQSGQVIEQMGKVAEQAQAQADSIKQAVKEVKELTDIIKVATNQQGSASLQVLEVLDGVNQVARQNAQSSRYISTAVTDLENLSLKLSLSLG